MTDDAASLYTEEVLVQVEGKIDQSAGMLDEEVIEKGYALLCVSEPRSDCKIQVIDEASIICSCSSQATARFHQVRRQAIQPGKSGSLLHRPCCFVICSTSHLPS